MKPIRGSSGTRFARKAAPYVPPAAISKVEKVAADYPNMIKANVLGVVDLSRRRSRSRREFKKRVKFVPKSL
jgi:hypothetical protein